LKLTKLIVLLSNNQTKISLKQNTILILLAFPDNNFREFIDSLLVQNSNQDYKEITYNKV
jgi:hypothetical protein